MLTTCATVCGLFGTCPTMGTNTLVLTFLSFELSRYTCVCGCAWCPFHRSDLLSTVQACLTSIRNNHVKSQQPGKVPKHAHIDTHGHICTTHLARPPPNTHSAQHAHVPITTPKQSPVRGLLTQCIHGETSFVLMNPVTHGVLCSSLVVAARTASWEFSAHSGECVGPSHTQG